MISRGKEENVCVNQSNSAKYHNPRSNGHKNRKSIRRSASKIRRQIYQKEDRNDKITGE